MTRSRTADALAGFLAAAVALGMAELATGITGGASLIVEVGDVIVERTPGPVIKWAIGLLGTNDKPFLLASARAFTFSASTGSSNQYGRNCSIAGPHSSEAGPAGPRV